MTPILAYHTRRIFSIIQFLCLYLACSKDWSCHPDIGSRVSKSNNHQNCHFPWDGKEFAWGGEQIFASTAPVCCVVWDMYKILDLYTRQDYTGFVSILDQNQWHMITALKIVSCFFLKTASANLEPQHNSSCLNYFAVIVNNGRQFILSRNSPHSYCAE